MRKLIFIVIICLASTIALTGCGDPTPEEKKAELKQAVETMSSHTKRMDEISGFWKETWSELGSGKITRVEGQKRMDFIFEESMKVSRKITEVDPPSWMKKEAKEKFTKMIEEYNLACNMMATAAREVSPMLTKNNLTQYDMDLITTRGKDYQGFLLRGSALFASFKNGYGVE